MAKKYKLKSLKSARVPPMKTTGLNSTMKKSKI